MSARNHFSIRYDCIVHSLHDRKRLAGWLVFFAGFVLVGGYGQSDDAIAKRGPIDITTNSIGMKLALIPPGEFLMGSPVTENGRHENERQHVVRIPHSFRLGVHEVTQAEWTAVMETTPWKGRAFVTEGNRYPATYVSWQDASEFCRKLTDRERQAGRLKTGQSYRLPTEAEWEYACRAGSETGYQFWDDEATLGDYAWYLANTKAMGAAHPHEVGRKRANAWGLFDMHGNVSECCIDWYASYSTEASVARRGPARGLYRVVRGGGWDYDASRCRSAIRGESLPDARGGDLGFRIALGAVPRRKSDASTRLASVDSAFDQKPGTVITNSIGMKLALIPSGEFLMGSPDSDDQAHDHEKPRHRVRITQPFHMGIHEVSQKQWADVMGTTPWKGESFVNEGDRYPATYVSWEDATEFCRKLTNRDRRVGTLDPDESYRLPTEAEWEYACRAGSTTRYHCGDGEASLVEYAWHNAHAEETGEPYAHEVGRKRANPWGLFDSHGNVLEWCSDRYGSRYYSDSPMEDPQGPSMGGGRVFRGGCCEFEPRYARSAQRSWIGAARRFNFLGFRVARSYASSD